MIRNQDNGKRLLWDGRTRVLLACASAPALIETAYLAEVGEAGDATLLIALLAVVGCLLMALLPRVGGWAIVALWTARCVIPETTPFSVLFCLLMAVTIMAYLDIGMALPAAMAAEAATAARIWLYPWDSSVFVIVCATAAFLMVALWLGSMMGWRERQETKDREHAELLHRAADRELATQLHHSVTNDLTTILLLSVQLRSKENSIDHLSPEDHDTVTLIERTARESLTKVRTLIAGLDSKPDSPASPADERPIPPTASGQGRPLTTLTDDELRSLAASYDERLHANGLTGTIIVNGEPSTACTAERKAALMDALHETVGNMMKYADPAAGYCIAVTLSPGLATLSASNGMCGAACDRATAASGRTPPDKALHGGTGLDRCRRAATNLGGTFDAGADNGAWTTMLTLPLV
ncbi:hypothetical protein [Bifidobacterium aerophilum]|uniref:Signal transduction histidine kinase subgroup 3 dimerisation and phosphoacceptor domain-containing protein n=1 Tax=Bifidobacterium aerophilum TaxID=1798155 RepID=A0A6N9Z2X3_9BIFI|nr:hypothetical protein [Bifidobacterium aerophilum]NEG88938.1 hypothetical protein [Bifidobacterium aerophilum]